MRLGRSTVSFRKELLNAEGEPRYPDQRRGGVNIDSLDDVPTLNYWLDSAPFTLTDLTQIFTLLAPVDADEARIFLAEIHYYFMTKRSKTDRSHIEALFGGGRIPFEPFFFAVKCLIQGHVSSTVRTPEGQWSNVLVVVLRSPRPARHVCGFSRRFTMRCWH